MTIVYQYNYEIVKSIYQEKDLQERILAILGEIFKITQVEMPEFLHERNWTPIITFYISKKRTDLIFEININALKKLGTQKYNSIIGQIQPFAEKLMENLPTITKIQSCVDITAALNFTPNLKFLEINRCPTLSEIHRLSNYCPNCKP